MAIPLSSIVDVTVNLENPGITRAGFGTPLLLSNTGNAWATPELVRSYVKGGFATDFPAGTVENLILTSIFSQPAPPDVVKVGKGTHKPTRTLTLSVSSVQNSTNYTVNAYNDGLLWSSTYTSDSSATNDEIVNGLVALLTPAAWVNTTGYTVGDRVTNDSGKAYQCITTGTSAGSGGPTGTGSDILDGTVHWEYVATPNFTATATGAGGSKIVTATGNAAGNWFALEPIASGDPTAVSNLLALTDTTADPSYVSTDLTSVNSFDSDWYGLLVIFKSKAILSTSGTGVSPWASSNGKLLLASCADTASATSAYSGATDALATLTGQGSSYTAPQWHPRDYECLDACTFGYFLSLSPGSDNWRLKTLTGPTPVSLTPTQQANLDARRAGYFSTLGGQNLLCGMGAVESTLYGFIDTRRNIDWYATNLQADLIDLLVQNNKLANTNAGRRKIATAIANRNDLGIAAGVISPDPLDATNTDQSLRIYVPYTVTVPDISNTDSFNPATRALSGVSTTWKLANPINSIAVTVNVTQ